MHLVDWSVHCLEQDFLLDYHSVPTMGKNFRRVRYLVRHIPHWWVHKEFPTGTHKNSLPFHSSRRHHMLHILRV